MPLCGFHDALKLSLRANQADVHRVAWMVIARLSDPQ
jgi:hypothetical protein